MTLYIYLIIFGAIFSVCLCNSGREFELKTNENVKDTQDQQWAVNITSAGGKDTFVSYWSECVGSGHAVLLLRSDWRQYMEHAQEIIGFKYVRAHGILDDDVGSVNNVNDYSFINIDKIYEYLLSINMKPYIEISFMPDKFASNLSDTVCHYKGNTSPPKSFEVWYDFIQQWVQHLVDHFGIEEVKQWRFECWNEPNIAFWRGTYEQYLTLYNYTATAIKSVSSELMIGGPTTAGENWLDNFLTYVLSNDIPIDFVVTHAYPNQVNNGQHVSTINTYLSVLNDALSIVDTYNVKYNRSLNLIISEYNSGCCITPFGKFMNDDNYYSAAFLIFMANKLQPLFQKRLANGERAFTFMSYWSISDVFEEAGFNSHEFWNGYGLQSIHGVPKPAFRAMQLLTQFGSDTMFDATLVAGNGLNLSNNTVQMYCLENGNDDNRYSIFVANWNNYGFAIDSQFVTINVQNSVMNGDLRLSLQSIALYMIDDTHTNPLDAWKTMGSPEYLTQPQLQELNATSQLQPITNVNYTVVNQNTIQLTKLMDPYSVAVFDLRYS